MALHPDAGGSHADMVRLNAALEEALAAPKEPVPTTVEPMARRDPPRGTRLSRDVSCFTIDSLPVDAHHLMTLVAAQCGQVVDDEPPYLIEFTMNDCGVSGWWTMTCRCELVPEAGSTMVHLTVFGVQGPPVIEDVRDHLVACVNEIGSQ